MSKFTPGKWMVDGNGVSVFDERKEATLFIVDNVWEWEDTEGEADANARLIAAAPEMYAFLKDCVEALYMNACPKLKRRALELLASIDGEEAEI